MAKIFKYGMRARGIAPMCQPKDIYDWADDDTSSGYYSFLWYKRKLTNEELREYELDFLGVEEE